MSRTTYDESSIKIYRNREMVRHRPDTFVGDTELYGLYHTIKEIIDNANDEATRKVDGLVDVWFFRDQVKGTYQVAVWDNGRGIPIGMLTELFTELGSSGKHNTDAYEASAGQLGYGTKVAAGLSAHLRAVTVRDGQLASLYLQTGLVVAQEEVPSLDEPTGTWVVMEPDPTIFTMVPAFTESGYERLVTLLQMLTVFSYTASYRFQLVNQPIDPAIWTCPAVQAYSFVVDRHAPQAQLLFDSTIHRDPTDFLRQYWGIDDQFIWVQEGITKPLPKESDEKLGYSLKLYLTKRMKSGDILTLVNGIPMHDNLSSHVLALVNVLRLQLLSFFENEELRNFFLATYPLPIYGALAITYKGARFSGAMKDKFKNTEFQAEFETALKQHFQLLPQETWLQLYELLLPDIEAKYNQFYNKTPSRTKAQKLGSKLWTKYYDCSTSDRSKAELFIVEGESAKHILHCRNKETHGIFLVQGKPTNVLRGGGTEASIRQRIENEKYPAYQQLRDDVLCISSKQTDLSTCRYGKIIIMADADPDGQHITALHTGGLHSINSRIISSGMVYLANPPLYEIALQGSSQKIFAKNEQALTEFCVRYLYRKTLDLSIVQEKAFKEPRKLEGDEFRDFCYLVVHAGTIFTTLEGRLAVPALILEKLVQVSYALGPKVDMAVLKQTFGPTTQYTPEFDTLTISQGAQDISFSLHGVREAIYEELLPFLSRIAWKQFRIHARSKYAPDQLNHLVTIVQLYQIFLTLNGKFKITRRKGLGGMSPADLFTTCMNPHTRALHHITSLGDVERIYGMLGDDVSARKRMLAESGLLESY